MDGHLPITAVWSQNVTFIKRLTSSFRTVFSTLGTLVASTRSKSVQELWLFTLSIALTT